MSAKRSYSEAFIEEVTGCNETVVMKNIKLLDVNFYFFF